MERFADVSCQVWISITEKILRVWIGLSIGVHWHAGETILV